MVVYLGRLNVGVVGLGQCADGSSAIFDTEGKGDVASVEAIPTSGNAWSAGILKVRKTNARSGPYKDYGTAQSLTAAAPMTGLLAIESQFLVVEVTTLEAGVYVDLYVHMRPSNIGTAVIT